MRELEYLIEKSVQIQREHPDYVASSSVGERIRELIDSRPFRVLDS